MRNGGGPEGSGLAVSRGGMVTHPVEILLVEDNPGDVCLTLEALEDFEIRSRVSVVDDGEKALSYLRRRGPYALWYHEHRFEPKDGGVLMTDRVTYALPFGCLGDLVHALWVGRQLRQIFDFRRDAVAKAFAQ